MARPSRTVGLVTALVAPPTAAAIFWPVMNWVVLGTIGLALLGVFILVGGVLFSRRPDPSDRLQRLVQVILGRPGTACPHAPEPSDRSDDQFVIGDRSGLHDDSDTNDLQRTTSQPDHSHE